MNKNINTILTQNTIFLVDDLYKFTRTNVGNIFFDEIMDEIDDLYYLFLVNSINE
jgi:hypothetical protein